MSLVFPPVLRLYGRLGAALFFSSHFFSRFLTWFSALLAGLASLPLGASRDSFPFASGGRGPTLASHRCFALKTRSVCFVCVFTLSLALACLVRPFSALPELLPPVWTSLVVSFYLLLLWVVVNCFRIALAFSLESRVACVPCRSAQWSCLPHTFPLRPA